MIDHAELLVPVQLAELDRRAAVVTRSADARRAVAVAATAPSATVVQRRSRAGHAPGVWCWLLDRLPARAQRHAAA